MKVVITTDWHADLRPFMSDSVSDSIEDVEKHVKALCTEGGDWLVHCGDVFDTAKPLPEYIDAVEEMFLRLLDAYDKVYVLEGNHTLGACKYLRNIGVNVISEVTSVSGALFVPYYADMAKDLDGALKRKNFVMMYGHYHALSYGVNGIEESFIARKVDRLPVVSPAFLGHIHKAQDSGDVHYIGSAIRCDFAERDEEKGYGVYSTTAKTYHWNPVEVQRYTQIALSKTPTQAQIAKLSGAVVKIIYSGDVDVPAIRKAVNAVGFIKQEEYIRTEDKTVVNAAVSTATADLFTTALQSWVKDHADKKQVNDVMAICQEHLQGECADVGVSRDVVINGISIHNYGLYGDVELHLHASLYGIIGRTDADTDESNGSGKSLLVDAIVYALYGYTRSSVAEVVRDGCTECQVKLVFTVGEHKCVLTRMYDTVKQAGSATLTVNGEVASRGAGVEKYVETTLLRMGYDALVNTAFFRQDDQEAFALATDSGRLDSLKRYLNLDGIDRALKKVKQRVSAQSTDLSLKKREIEVVTEQLTEFEDVSVKTAQADIKSIEVKQEKLTMQRAELMQQVKASIALSQKYDTYVSLTADLTKRKREIKQYEEQLSDLREAEGEPVDIETVTKQLSEAEKAIATLSTQLKAIEEDAKYYKNIADNPKCPFTLDCPHLSSDKFMQGVQNELSRRRAAYKTVNAQLGKAVAEQVTCSRSVKVCKDALSEREYNARAVAKVESSIESCKKMVVEINKKLKAVGDIEKPTESVEVLETRLESVNNELSTLTDKKAQIRNAMERQGELLSKSKVLSKELKAIEQTHALYVIAESALSRDGFVLGFLQSGMEYISSEANAILQRFGADYSVTLTVISTRGTAGLCIKVIHRGTGSVRSYATYSGAQKSIITFALRLAVYRLLILRGLAGGFLVLDEVLGKMDSKNRSTFLRVLSELTSTFKQVLCISHTSVKDVMPNIIEVVRSGSISGAKVIS